MFAKEENQLILYLVYREYIKKYWYYVISFTKHVIMNNWKNILEVYAQDCSPILTNNVDYCFIDCMVDISIYKSTYCDTIYNYVIYTILFLLCQSTTVITTLNIYFYPLIYLLSIHVYNLKRLFRVNEDLFFHAFDGIWGCYTFLLYSIHSLIFLD